MKPTRWLCAGSQGRTTPRDGPHLASQRWALAGVGSGCFLGNLEEAEIRPPWVPSVQGLALRQAPSPPPSSARSLFRLLL